MENQVVVTLEVKTRVLKTAFEPTSLLLKIDDIRSPSLTPTLILTWFPSLVPSSSPVHNRITIEASFVFSRANCCRLTQPWFKARISYLLFGILALNVLEDALRFLENLHIIFLTWFSYVKAQLWLIFCFLRIQKRRLYCNNQNLIVSLFAQCGVSYMMKI